MQRKIKTMIIGSRQRIGTLGNENTLHVKIADATLLNVHCEKLFGVRTDSNLTWKMQVDFISKTVSQRLVLLRRIQPFID